MRRFESLFYAGIGNFCFRASDDPDAWEKLQRALKAQIPPELFEQMRGTTSFPFQPGEHGRIAVKVIDFRGNEVVRVVSLEV